MTNETPTTFTRPRGGRTFVLVHGAWYGAWVWKHVAPALRVQGHEVWTPTLTGLGARRHLASFPYDLSTHVEDVVQMIEMEDIWNVELVGWSYGGMVITGVQSRLIDRIRSMIYLDAFVPKIGEAVVDYLPPDLAQSMHAKAAAMEDIPPPPPSTFGVHATLPDVLAYVKARVVSQSAQCFTQPSAGGLPPDAVPCTYIHCTGVEQSRFTQFFERARLDAQFETHRIAASHVCMLTDPTAATDLLLRSR